MVQVELAIVEREHVANMSIDAEATSCRSGTVVQVIGLLGGSGGTSGEAGFGAGFL